MAWKKYFRSYSVPNTPTIPANPAERASMGTSSKFSSFLPEVYAGHPHRIQRYYQYDDMDKDSDINAALDTISDFATQSEEQSDEPFEIVYNNEANETEVKLLKSTLEKWVKINDFRSRLWFMFRNTIKNGDSFFLRDPETYEWLWIDHFMVEMVKVDETSGKEPDEYIIRGLDYNKQAKFTSIAADPSQYRMPLGSSNATGSRPAAAPASGPNVFSLAGSAVDQRQRRMLSGQGDQLYVVDAKHVIHLSLSVGMDVNWPFGQSVLEPVFKTYKQKELLEDAIIIYRVSRAPERRIFYIDTGSMPPVRAKAHLEQIKNEIHQRRIPNRSGGGSSVLDAAFNPLSTMDDYFFASSCFRLNTPVLLLDGRTLTFSQLIEEYNAGKTNYVYSMNKETKTFEPGKIAWAGVTRKNAEMVRVTLDNGEYVDCTPDHRFITRDGKEVEAKDLQPGVSLMPLYRYDTDDFKSNYHHNHKVVSIECLTDREDTADITVESASNSHIFALGIGVYVHNSDGRGSKVETLPGGECFALDTKIVLLDGRSLPLSEIITEFEQGKQLWTYSCNPETGAVVPGMINWAGVTRKNAQVVKITLDNGKSVVVTPDHKFPVQGRGIVEARDLTPEDSLFPFETRKEEIWKGRSKEYLQVFDTSTKKWVFVHRLVAKYFREHELVRETVFDADYQDTTKNTVHHIDFNRLNNDPENLTWMNFKDHRAYHSSTGHLAREGLRKYFESMTDEEKRIRGQGISDRIKASIAKKTESELAEFFARSTLNLEQGNATERALWLLQNDPEWRADVLAKRGKGISEAFDDSRRDFYGKSMKTRWEDGKYDKNVVEQTLIFDDADEISYTQLVSILQDNGYDSWKDFKAAGGNFNHRIVSIEWLDEKQDTGTVTIDGAEVFHNYHNLALDVGIYSQNSLGEITDLTFFSKKLARGLRIPPSYLSIGEDQNAPIAFNDGKLGAALIQEFRFNKYCMRIQSLMSPVFDKEFRNFLERSGIEIDDNLFELRFNPPQNFTKYRQIELDTQQVSVYSQISENKRLSERFKLKRFLNLTEDEIVENERLYAEENAAKLKKKIGSTPAEDTSDHGLTSVGIRPGGVADFGDMNEPLPGENPDASMGEQDGASGPGPDGGGGMSAGPGGGGEGPPGGPLGSMPG